MILNFLKKQQRIIRRKRLSDELILSTDSFYNGMDVFCNYRTGLKRLEIGHNCVIDGQFIFEKDTGHVSIGDRVHIGGNTKIISINDIFIGNDVTIAWDCTIYDHNSHSIYWNKRQCDTKREYDALCKGEDPIKTKDWTDVKTKPIVIQDKVWIGFGVIILKGVTIGEGAVIGAGSVVTKDIPAWTVAAGNPAKVIYCIEEKRL